MQRELQARKTNRLQGYDYAEAGYYFITVCVKDAHEMLGTIGVGAATCRPLVALSDIGEIADSAIKNIPKIYPHISVDKYVIMPNHIHMILRVMTAEGGRQVAAPTTLQTVVGNMKRYVSMQCGFSIWQKSFHDHIIRSEADYRRIWQYIDENPAKWDEDKYFVKENTKQPHTD